jgi:hypothetical protein
VRPAWLATRHRQRAAARAVADRFRNAIHLRSAGIEEHVEMLELQRRGEWAFTLPEHEARLVWS